eukprot:757018-Hanusia_phi.AAC.5
MELGSPTEEGNGEEQEEGEEQEQEQRMEVTLVTQLSWDKFSSLLSLRSRWPGPCVAAVLVPRSGTSELDLGVKQLRRLHHETTQVIAVWEDELPSERYPINAMRNIALAHARTDLVFLCDVDQLPSLTFSALLQQEDVLMQLWRWCCVERNAIVIAALELRRGGGKSVRLADVLDDIDMTRRLLEEEDPAKPRVVGFQTETFPRGHAPERLRERWFGCTSIEGRRKGKEAEEWSEGGGRGVGNGGEEERWRERRRSGGRGGDEGVVAHTGRTN